MGASDNGAGARQATRPSVAAAILILLPLVALACGTRVESGAPVPSAAQGSGLALSTMGDAGVSPEQTQASPVSNTPGVPVTGASPSGGVPTASPSEPRAGSAGSVASPKAAGNAVPGEASAGSSKADGTAGKGVVAPPGTPGGPGTPSPPVPARERAGKEIVFGLVGQLSGPGGNSLGVPLLKGVQMWVQSVNARGGVKGHPVKFVSADDGADPARHRAQVQDLVENRRVIAFVANPEHFSGKPSIPYLESKRIPVIGLGGGEAWAYESPMYFPQASAGPALVNAFYRSYAQQMVPQGKTKLGVLYCVEGEVCRDFANRSDEAVRAGMTVVFKAQISIAQPDYTAECLSARNAGVQVLFGTMDVNSVRRLGTSCTRQGFQPVFAIGSQGQDESLKNEAMFNNSLISAFTTFPYFQTDTPATAEFQQAVKQSGRDLAPAAGLVIGWVAGKLAERAASLSPDPTTNVGILTGLWSIKNDDLGGIAPPLTFTENQKPPETVCWWNAAIVDARWVSPDGFKRHCGEVNDHG